MTSVNQQHSSLYTEAARRKEFEKLAMYNLQNISIDWKQAILA